MRIKHKSVIHVLLVYEDGKKWKNKENVLYSVYIAKQ